MIRGHPATPSAASGAPSMLTAATTKLPAAADTDSPGRPPADGVEQGRPHRRVGVEDQPLLDREVVEDRLLDHPGALGDLHHADGVEAALGEQVGGGVDDAGPGLLAAQLPAPGAALAGAAGVARPAPARAAGAGRLRLDRAAPRG